MSEKLLASVTGNVELFLYEGILKENDIPYVIRQKGMANYMKVLTGPSKNMEADIFVGGEDYDRAVELTEIIRTEPNQAPDNPENPDNRKKKVFAWIIAGLFIIIIIAVLLRL